ncbi:MAG: hypothetical protein ACRC6U_09160 [Fusobacteriaceae bacterium]
MREICDTCRYYVNGLCDLHNIFVDSNEGCDWHNETNRNSDSEQHN